MSPNEVLNMVKEKSIKFIDFKFQDFPGTWQHFTVPAHCLEEDSFEDGYGFDGSSIRGWKAINESDMLILPDPATAFVDPFTEIPTLSLTCSILDPITHQPYTRDPRNVATKCIEYIKSTGIADTAYFGPEAEFFIFDSARFGTAANYSMFEIDSEEGIWNSDASIEGGNKGHRPRHKEGYFPVPPTDALHDLRSEMVDVLMSIGVEVEAHHHEVATAGQCEIDMKFGALVHMADQLMMYKYVVKNVAKKWGKTVTFMPKPMFGDNGSGMHVHSSLWKGDKPLFAGDKYAGLSDMALHYIGGILKHAPALIAFCAPTTNSYKRLVPGYEAPVNLAYSQRNRSAAVRIPMYSPSPKAKRVEFRCPDPSCNPYFAFSAIAMAGMDGILNKIDPGDPFDKNLYDLPPEELAKVPQVPGSLEGAIEALEKDHAFLLQGDVYTQDVIDTWIEYKRSQEVDPLRLRPHPYEFFLYYDC
ncbi:MAG: type I glutamate--ammonia ligase [Candidatus Omnitrophica bacterium]|nr:type I glutamate--ammonia ligase [Candidatus Omnitrophota bacterium]